MKKHGVRITIGCDNYIETSRVEAMYLHQLNIFSNLELLKMWCENTPAAIFPDRKIGHLREGYEANFLVVKEDPLKNFENVKEITLRVKQGLILTIK